MVTVALMLKLLSIKSGENSLANIEGKKMKRQYYIDNLRWIWIALLIPFHTAMAWNCWESNYIWFHKNKILSSFVIFIHPYYMPLLFLLAGMSMKYALEKRSYSEFLVERVKKLAIPMVTSILTIVAFMTYLADKYHNNYQGNFFNHYGVFFTKIKDLTGYNGDFTPGHLWFVLYLFLISIILLGLVYVQRKRWPQISFANIKPGILLVLILIPILLKPVLDFGGKSIGENFAYVILGYYIFSEDSVLERIKKYRYAYLIIMLFASFILTYLFVWSDNQYSMVCTILQWVATWFGILAFLGIGKCSINKSNRLNKYMASRSFLIYIFHFGWIIFLQYTFSKLIYSTALLYLLTVIGAFILSLATVEVIRKIPGIRWLFGVKIN